ELESLIDDIECDVAIMHAPPGWRLATAKRVVVPMGGRGEEHKLRARILGSLCRTAEREFHFVTVVSTKSSEKEREEVHERITRLARSHVPGTPTVDIIEDAGPVAGLCRAIVDADLVVLGLRSDGAPRRVTSRISLAIASEAAAATATLLLSSKPTLDV